MATKRFTMTDDDSAKGLSLRASVFGKDPQAYKGQFEEAYKTLGQGPNANPGVVESGTYELADDFIQRVFERTGQLPSEAQVRDFVSASLTPGYAGKYISGTTSRDAIKSGLVDPYVMSMPDEFTPGNSTASGGIPAPGDEASGLRARLNDIFGTQREALTKQVGDIFNPMRSRAIEEEAALGRLRSPVSRVTLQNIDAQQADTLAKSLGQLASEQGRGELDTTAALEGIFAGERRAKEAGEQFNRNFGLSLRALNDNADENFRRNALANRELAMAEILGRKQGQQAGNAGMGIAGGAISGAGTGAMIGGPWGALIGGLAGAGLGYAGSNRKF